MNRPVQTGTDRQSESVAAINGPITPFVVVPNAAKKFNDLVEPRLHIGEPRTGYQAIQIMAWAQKHPAYRALH
jgi:hypothetical protein